jgi:hypothetical protein
MAFTNIFEGPSLIDAIDEYDPSGALVVSLRDVFESLLSSRIPNLQLDALISHTECLYLEINPDGGHIIHPEHILTKTKEDVSLANSTITNYYDLEYLLLGSFFTHLLLSSSKSTRVESLY